MWKNLLTKLQQTDETRMWRNVAVEDHVFYEIVASFTFHSGFEIWFGWFAKRFLPACFGAIVLRSFAPSQDTFEKSAKRKNSHHRRLRLVWAQESVQRLSQVKRRLADLPTPFPHAIHSASNNHKSFKYNILSNYAAFIAIHDTCKNQT